MTQHTRTLSIADQDFLDELFAKNKIIWDIAGDMMAKDDDDDESLDTPDDDDLDEDDGSENDDSDDEDNENDNDEDSDEEDFTDDELDAMADELAEDESDEDEELGATGKALIVKLRKALSDNGIDPKTLKKKVKAEDIPGSVPKGDVQIKQARVALKDLASEYGFDPEYNDVLSKLASKVKFDEDGDLVKSSVKAIVSDLRERKSAFFTTDDSDEDIPTTTRKIPGKPKEKRAGVRNTRTAPTGPVTMRNLEKKINAKQQLTLTEASKLSADESRLGSALYDRAVEFELLRSIGL